MRYPDLPGGGQGESPIHLKVEPGSESVEVPNGNFLLTADYARLGSDLLLEGEDGPPVLIQGYFTETGERPMLVNGEGAKIAPKLVDALSGSLTPAQIAQASGIGGAEQIGQVSEVSGDVRVIRTNGLEESLSLEDPVFQGDVLISSDGSTVGITFLDDTIFSLTGAGRLVLDELVFNPGGDDNQLTLNLLQGTFALVSGQIAGANGPGLSVETPVATIGVRGTTTGGRLGPVTPDFPQPLTVALLQDLISETVGVVDIFTANALVTLSQALTAAGAAPDGSVFSVPLSPALQTALANALVSLRLAIIRSLEPEAGEGENIPQDGGNTGLAPNIFFSPEEATQFGENFDEAPEGVTGELFNALLALAGLLPPPADPNLIDTVEGEGGEEAPSATSVAVTDAEGPENMIAAGVGAVIPLEISADGAVTISNIPPGASLVNGAGLLLAFPAGGSTTLPPAAFGDPGFGIIPPQFDDSNFTLLVGPADGSSAPQPLFVQVDAVANLALVDNDPAPCAPAAVDRVEQNPILQEAEGFGDSGLNDTIETAQDLGETNGDDDQTLTVNGWISVNDPGDVDVYCVVITRDGNYTFDIDFGDLSADQTNMTSGRVASLDAMLELFDEDGTPRASDSDSGPGVDPLISGVFLTVGTYYIAVSSEASGEEEEGSEGGGDYQLQVRGPGGDVTPGDVITVMVMEEFDGETQQFETTATVYGYGLRLNAADTDGSEAITQVNIDVDNAPPDFMLDLGSGNFIMPGDTTVDLTVTRFGVPGQPVVTASLSQEPGGLLVITFPVDDILEVDLSNMRWAVDVHDDGDFSMEITTRTTETNPTEGEGTLDTTEVAIPHAYQTVTLEINTKAVADPALITLDSYTAEEIGLVKNEIQQEREARGFYGNNDTIAMAQNLGTLATLQGQLDGFDPALTVNGWMSKGTGEDARNELDVYKFMVDANGNYTIDIDYARQNAGDEPDAQGRVDAFDAFLSLFDKDGNLVDTNDNTQGTDPLITANLVAGEMYFAVVTYNGNQPVGPTFDDGFTGEQTGGNGGDYQLQVRQAGVGDITPGSMIDLTVFVENGEFQECQEGCEEGIIEEPLLLHAMVVDDDGSESITRLEFQVPDAPDGFKLDLGDGFITETDSGSDYPFLVSRINGSGDLVDDEVDGELFFDEASQTYVVTFDPDLRIQEVDLENSARFKLPYDYEETPDPFMIEVHVRTTETDPSEGGTNNLDQVATPHAYQTLTINVLFEDFDLVPSFTTSAVQQEFLLADGLGALDAPDGFGGQLFVFDVTSPLEVTEILTGFDPGGDGLGFILAGDQDGAAGLDAGDLDAISSFTIGEATGEGGFDTLIEFDGGQTLVISGLEYGSFAEIEQETTLIVAA